MPSCVRAGIRKCARFRTLSTKTLPKYSMHVASRQIRNGNGNRPLRNCLGSRQNDQKNNRPNSIVGELISNASRILTFAFDPPIQWMFNKNSKRAARCMRTALNITYQAKNRRNQASAPLPTSTRANAVALPPTSLNRSPTVLDGSLT